MRRFYGCLLQVLPLVLVGCGDHDADDDTQHAPCSTSGALPDDPSGAAETGSPGASAGPGEPGTTTAAPGTSAADTTTSSGDSTAGSGAESASDGDSTGGPGDGDTGGGPDETTGDGETSGESTAGSGDTTTGDTTTGDTTTGDGGSTGGDAGPSFMGEIWPLFSGACGCHKDSNGAGGLVLKKSNAFANMVGKASSQLPDMKLVEPGDPANSYLWHKLNDTQKSVGGKGKKMPPGGLLKKDALALVQQWIEQGAAP